MARVALLVFSGMDVSTAGSPTDAWKVNASATLRRVLLRKLLEFN
jgi:hypothetical protein